MGPQCLRCGAEPWPEPFAGPEVQGHHATGRDERGDYLDPELVLPFCHDCHQLVHDDWNTLGLADEERRQPLVAWIELRLWRLVAALERLREAAPGNTLWPRLSQVAARIARELAQHIRHLDERYPDWREDPGFYPGGAAPG
jgi:hypothetical protein